MVGDFNVAQNKEIDRKGNNTARYNHQAHKKIWSIMEKDPVDIWRLKYQKEKKDLPGKGKTRQVILTISLYHFP